MSTAGPLPRPDARVALAAVLDVILVIAFTGIGRRTHEEGLDLAGWAHTAWPFLVGLAFGWVLVLLTRRTWPTGWRAGVPVWLATVIVGMLLRALSGQGTALPFVIVATLFLCATLVGWRVVAGLLNRA